MESQSSNLERKVGAFVAIGLALAMGSILALGGNRIAFKRYLRAYVYFEEVQGLFPGSVVSLAGLPVGNVSRIEFAPGDAKLRVELEIDRDFSPRITEGTTADVRTQGALGDKYVYLNPGPISGKAIAEGATLPVNESGDFLKMLTSKEDGIGQIISLVKEMRALVASMNANGRMAGALENASTATAQLKSTLVQMDGLLKDLRGEMPKEKKLQHALVALSSVLEKIDKGQGTLGALVNDPSVHQRLKALLGGSPRGSYLKDMLKETIQKAD